MLSWKLTKLNMATNIQSRRAEALDKFALRVEADLSAKAEQSISACDVIDFDNHNVHEPDSATLLAEAEVYVRSQLSVETQRIVRELNNVREQLLTVGCEAVSEGALVTLEEIVDEKTCQSSYLIVPNGKGDKIILDDGTRVTCVSPEAPLAQNLEGYSVGDEVDVVAKSVGRERALAIVSIE